MAAKKKAGKGANKSAGIPLGGAFEVVEGAAGILGRYLSQRYEVEKRVEEFKEDTSEKVEEIKEEAIKTGYEVKKAFFRTIVEGILLTTGMLSLIAGLILVVRDIIPLKYVLVSYGFIITLVVLIQLKTSPQPQ